MDRLTFHTGTETVEFGIGTRKFLCGENVKRKYNILKTLRQTLGKIKDSEFAEAHGMTKKMLLNGEDIKVKKSRFFTISQHYDYLEDMKLKTGSTMYLFLQEKLRDIEYTDEFNTLAILFKDFSGTMNERITEETGLPFTMDLQLTDLHLRQLLKMASLSLQKDDEEAHPYDMDYEENIIFQLDLIIETASRDGENDYYGYLDVPLLTDKVIDKTESLPKNLRIIIPTRLYPAKRLEEVVIVERKTIDLADDVQLYEKITMSLSNHVELTDTESVLRDYLGGKRTLETDQLRAVL